MLQVAFCDDMPKEITVLISYLKELRKPSFIIQSVPFYSGRELLSAYKEGKRFDLVVLDMVMGGMDGMSIAKEIRQIDFEVPIIIVTGTPAFAMEGYKVQAYRYLLKPVNKTQFLNCVKEILSNTQRTQTEYFSFNCEIGLVKINLADIYYFMCEGKRNIRVYSKTGEYTFFGFLKNVEKQLPQDYFMRQHMSYIVNLKHVFLIRGKEIVLDDKTVLPLSGRKGKETRAKLLACMRLGI